MKNTDEMTTEIAIVNNKDAGKKATSIMEAKDTAIFMNKNNIRLVQLK